MAGTVEAVGTQVATVGTEHTLSGAEDTVAGVYVLTVKANVMVNGDVLRLRAYVRTQSTDAVQPVAADLAYEAYYQHAQGDTIKLSPPIPNQYGIAFTLTQIAGTSRTFPYRIERF